MVPKHIIAAQIVRSFMASVSCFASSFLCFTIWCARNRLSSPYSRIIFGLSIADIFMSVGLLLGQVLSPADTPDAIFSKGTIASCEAIGYIMLIGFFAYLLNTLCLTYYFLMRVKYKMTPQDFAKRQEKVICTFAWFYAICITSFALKRDEINGTQYGSVCSIATSPWECRTNEDIECIRGGGSRLTISISGITMLLSFLCQFTVLTSFTCHIYKAESELEYTRESQTSSLTKQAAQQSILYIVSFMIVYSGPVIAVFLRFSGNENPPGNFWIIAIFQSIGGFLNMLIYTRPKVIALKKTEPQIPTFICFLCVVLAGGEVPCLAEIMRPASSVRESNIDHWARVLGWDITSNNLDEELESRMRGVVVRNQEEEEDKVDNISFEEDNINLSIDDTTRPL
ncbi:hypothetical protein CTEN210_12806 [Chaetoceros tenuissimus]|uniref:G-protein coupled receptors family 1 profile domain-containing protein n=1 Tax=Chaetoceros tenuissimus TaxID=426638 RepID=A0AAD3HAF5_9STRA|nr:hypothetical protein CTEN210_12806 [Chaetoceros tenuissimus]